MIWFPFFPFFFLIMEVHTHQTPLFCYIGGTSEMCTNSALKQKIDTVILLPFTHT